jgi:hypothetical protein
MHKARTDADLRARAQENMARAAPITDKPTKTEPPKVLPITITVWYRAWGESHAHVLEFRHNEGEAVTPWLDGARCVDPAWGDTAPTVDVFARDLGRLVGIELYRRQKTR